MRAAHASYCGSGGWRTRMASVLSRLGRTRVAKKLANFEESVANTGKFARKMSADVGRSAEDRRPVFWPAGQFLTRHTRRVRSYIALCAILACGSACGGSNTGSTSNPANRPERGVVDRSALRRGGEIVASLRTDPQSFNRLVDNDVSSDLVAELTQARLVRINKSTWEAEPWLAESWTLSDDKLRYSIILRSGVAWSDGQPFTADDVVFTFAALYKTPLGDSVTVAGKKLLVTAADA